MASSKALRRSFLWCDVTHTARWIGNLTASGIKPVTDVLVVGSLGWPGGSVFQIIRACREWQALGYRTVPGIAHMLCTKHGHYDPDDWLRPGIWKECAECVHALSKLPARNVVIDAEPYFPDQGRGRYACGSTALELTEAMRPLWDACRDCHVVPWMAPGHPGYRHLSLMPRDQDWLFMDEQTYGASDEALARMARTRAWCWRARNGIQYLPGFRLYHLKDRGRALAAKGIEAGFFWALKTPGAPDNYYDFGREDWFDAEPPEQGPKKIKVKR